MDVVGEVGKPHFSSYTATNHGRGNLWAAGSRPAQGEETL